MTSSNINKFMQTHVNLKPWMLAKNTNEIVNTCINKIYKQMPHQFRKEKAVRVAAPRPENKGPLRTFKSQEAHTPLAVMPRTTTFAKKPPPKPKQHQQQLQKQQQQEKPLMNSLKFSNLNNVQIASKLAGVCLPTNNKRLLKSPNYKIYKSRRFGSSASSSRSSIYRRYEERKRQRQQLPPQINYLVRSFHTSQFEPSYVRYLMPARNQQVEAYLGSIPDAVKFSHDIQNDLMKVNSTTKGLLGIRQEKNVKLSNVVTKQKEFSLSPPLLRKYPESILKDSPVKSIRKVQGRTEKQFCISPEQREYAGINVNHLVPLKHKKPANEVFTAQHDRHRTELNEKHRRNRMQKLGLIMPSTETEAAEEETKNATTAQPSSNKTMSLDAEHFSGKDQQENYSENPLNFIKNKQSPRKYFKLNSQDENDQALNSKTLPKSLGSNLMALDKAPKFQASSSDVKEIKPTTRTTANRSMPTSSHIPRAYNIKSAIATVRAQMPPKRAYQASRYNRSDFFSTKKY